MSVRFWELARTAVPQGQRAVWASGADGSRLWILFWGMNCFDVGCSDSEYMKVIIGFGLLNR